MKTQLKLFMAIAILLMQSRQLNAQADCNTAAGVLALMVAKVVVGTPNDPSTLPAASNLPFNITSELFKVAQNESSNTTCFSKVAFKLYATTSSTALDNLPSLATANADFTPASTIKTSGMNKSRNGNVITAACGLSRTLFPTKFPGKGGVMIRSRVYYRIAKRITNCSSCSGQDPYVWSPVYSFLVPDEPAPVVVAKKADLIPQPTANSNRNRPLFKASSGSYGVGTESFLAIPSEFCINTLTQGSLVKSYPCGTSTCREFQQSFALTPVIYAAKNTGDTAAGSFSVSLFRKDQTLATASSLTAVSTNTVNSLGVNTESTIFSFNPNKTVTVYVFPDDNPGSCFIRCDPNTAGCSPPYQEIEYKVKVDQGNSATNGTVTEKSETNNEGNPMD